LSTCGALITDVQHISNHNRLHRFNIFPERFLDPGS
jgi:hypothetical protein